MAKTKKQTKSVKRKGSYSLAEKQQAAIEYAVTGSLTKTSKSTGIPLTTLATWKANNDADWDALIVQIRSEKVEEHMQTYSQIVEAAQNKALELIPNLTNAKDAITVAAISTDKGRILAGLPTSISASAGTDKQIQDMMKKFEAISDAYRERQVKIVSEQ